MATQLRAVSNDISERLLCRCHGVGLHTTLVCLTISRWVHTIDFRIYVFCLDLYCWAQTETLIGDIDDDAD
jgi:hypothetical protein